MEDTPEPAEVEDASPGAGQPASQVSSPASEEPAPVVSRTLTPDEMVTDLRTKVDRMGAVNMMAIDQFDDLESRHTFLTAQRKDLVDSIAATNDAIRKIDKTTRERFQEAFTIINQNFEGTFTTLFGGGKAGLVLLDESDALESGIDIIASPPGKRLQSIQLLSGGEKALTAEPPEWYVRTSGTTGKPKDIPLTRSHLRALRRIHQTSVALQHRAYPEAFSGGIMAIVSPAFAETGEAYKRLCVKQGQREGQFKTVALAYRKGFGFDLEAFAEGNR